MRRSLLLTSAVLIASCAQPSATRIPQEVPSQMTFQLTSSAFGDGAPIPVQHTCDGASQQLPVAWTGAPEDTSEFALTMDDPDANGFVHWVVTGIPRSASSLTAQLPEGASTGQSYRGPCPPSGTHHYVLTLYALSSPLGSFPTTPAQLKAAAAGKLLGTAVLTGTYKRQ